MAASKPKAVKHLVRRGVLGWSYLYYPDTKAPDGASWQPDGKYKTLTAYEPGQLDDLIAKIKAAAVAHFAGVELDWDDFKFPFEVHAEDSPRENWRNKVVLTAKSKFQPNVYDAKNSRLSPVLDAAGNPVTDSEGKPVQPKIKANSGDIVNIQVTFMPWDKTEEQTIVENGKKTKKKVTVRGLSLRLAGVQLIEKRAGGSGDGGFEEEDGYDSGATGGSSTETNDAVDDDGNGDF